MEKDYLKLSLDDIVFEHRNRTYGAYALRQQYGGRIERASVAGFAVFLLLIFSPKILEKLSAKTINLFGESVTLAAPPPIKNVKPKPTVNAKKPRRILKKKKAVHLRMLIKNEKPKGKKKSGKTK